MQRRALVIDTQPWVARHLETLCKPHDMQVDYAEDQQCLWAHLKNAQEPCILFMEVGRDPEIALDVVRKVRSSAPAISIVLTAANMDVRIAMEAARLGARDYLQKPFHAAQVEDILQSLKTSAVAEPPVCSPAMPAEQPPVVATTKNKKTVEESLGGGYVFLALAPAMQLLYEKALAIAPTDVPVLITGESGVGKEVVARLLHRKSRRSRQELVKVNCAALPNDLLESELFGYEQGAFTGAVRSKPGRFELSHQGTIFLDEIGEMAPPLQAKLLQVLQEGEFTRLGGRTSTKIDTRIIAATNIDIEDCIRQKTFREDLYYRLSAFVLHIPPLRQRKEEIPYLLELLARQFVESAKVSPVAFSSDLITLCLEYDWPGNIRELSNMVKRYLVLRDEDQMKVDLESSIGLRRAAVENSQSGTGMKNIVRGLKDHAETNMIRDALEQSHWNRRAAARNLNISYRTLLSKIRQYSLEAGTRRAG
ncbi:MAG TPA: sigma-54 dependent transcriptional regulator [Acidobacteriaceae bacterium]|nr:sigma-54 dependent transcriptional regulator [Acidobacteriaceae bacterium]